ncbi:unnamed protein product, partial [Trichobilharzia regenti]
MLNGASQTTHHTNGGKVNIYDNDRDSTLFPLVNHDEVSGMSTTTELNKGSAQLEREVELRAEAVVE